MFAGITLPGQQRKAIKKQRTARFCGALHLFSSTNRFEGTIAKDDVYICNQMPDLKLQAVLPYCSSDNQLVLDSSKVGVHHADSVDGVSTRLSGLNVGHLTVNLTMDVASIETNYAIPLESIMKTFARENGISMSSDYATEVSHTCGA